MLLCVYTVQGFLIHGFTVSVGLRSENAGEVCGESSNRGAHVQLRGVGCPGGRGRADAAVVPLQLLVGLTALASSLLGVTVRTRTSEGRISAISMPM